MKRKKTSLLSIGVVLSAAAFLGCGGNQIQGLLLNKEGNDFFLSKEGTKGQVKVENGNQNISEIFKLNVKSTELINSDLIAYKNTEDSINENKAVNLKLKYKSLTDHYAYAIITSDDKHIGENFIYFTPGQNTEGLMRALNISTGTLQGSALYTSLLDDLWTRDQDKTILNDALTNSSKKLEHTASLTIQKTTAGDYQISNIKVSGLNLATNSFTLQSSQYTTADLKKLQITLSTLFVNFNKAKDIFN